jgi:hypothetical protein
MHSMTRHAGRSLIVLNKTSALISSPILYSDMVQNVVQAQLDESRDSIPRNKEQIYQRTCIKTTIEYVMSSNYLQLHHPHSLSTHQVQLLRQKSFICLMIV